MKTRVVPLDPTAGPWPELEELGQLVRDGGLVAFPTETVYGIAANARDKAAVRRLLQLKGRPADKPLTLHLASVGDLTAVVGRVPRPAAKLAARFWPGPLTLVIDDRHGRPTGCRVPDVPLARAFLHACGTRVVAPSANPSGAPEPRTADEVLDYFDGLLDAVVDGGRCRHGRSSTVVRTTRDGGIEVLREGVVPAVDVREATARNLLFVCSGNRCRSPMAAAFAVDLLARRVGVAPDELLARGYRVESAGTDCILDAPATPEAEAAARDYGCDLSSHRARALTPTLLEDADEIYVATRGHRASILEFAADADDRVHLLDTRRRDIEDPYHGGARVYREIAQQIHKAIEDRLDDF